MLVPVDHSRPRATPKEKELIWRSRLSAAEEHPPIRGREEELNGVLRALRDARASGRAVQISVEGRAGMGRGLFAAECQRAARSLGLRTHGPVRCPGRDHRFPLPHGRCPVCAGGGPWTHALPAPEAAPPHRTAPTTRTCPASGRVWLRAFPESATTHSAHADERVYRIGLPALPHTAVLRVAEDILRVPPGPSLAAYLGRANGHPALVHESLIGLAEERALVRREGAADLCVDRSPARVHSWIDGVLRSVRVPVDRFLMVCASMGEEFSNLEPVGNALGATGDEVKEMSRVAIELGFLVADDRFRFQSSVVHEVFWSRIPRRFPSLIRHSTRSGASCRMSDRPSAGCDLTPQERRLVLLASEGFTNQQIAHRMKISQHTVNYHLKKLFRKYGVNSRVQLVRTALKCASPAADSAC